MFSQNEQRKKQYDGQEVSTRQLQVLYKTQGIEARIDTVHTTALYFKFKNQVAFDNYLSFITRHAIDQLNSLDKVVSFNPDSPQKVVIEVFKDQIPPNIEIPRCITINELPFTKAEAESITGKITQHSVNFVDKTKNVSKEVRDLQESIDSAIDQDKSDGNELIPNQEGDKSKKDTNMILDSLLETLLRVSKDSKDRLSPKPELYDLYDHQHLAIAQSTLAIRQAFIDIMSGYINLRQSNRSVTTENNQMYVFESYNIDIDGKKYKKIEVLIRPYDYIVDGKREAQARTSVKLYSDDLPGGFVTIRIDPPDHRYGGNIVFDIQTSDMYVKKDESKQIEDLYLGQKAGHHFSSDVKLDDYGKEAIANIHQTIYRHILDQQYKIPST
jgi:hypothetical protein